MQEKVVEAFKTILYSLKNYLFPLGAIANAIIVIYDLYCDNVTREKEPQECAIVQKSKRKIMKTRGIKMKNKYLTIQLQSRLNISSVG